jgi:hypothetical protein
MLLLAAAYSLYCKSMSKQQDGSNTSSQAQWEALPQAEKAAFAAAAEQDRLRYSAELAELELTVSTSGSDGETTSCPSSCTTDGGSSRSSSPAPLMRPHTRTLQRQQQQQLQLQQQFLVQTKALAPPATALAVMMPKALQVKPPGSAARKSKAKNPRSLATKRPASGYNIFFRLVMIPWKTVQVNVILLTHRACVGRPQ